MQRKLDEFKKMWNWHRVWDQRNLNRAFSTCKKIKNFTAELQVNEKNGKKCVHV